MNNIPEGATHEMAGIYYKIEGGIVYFLDGGRWKKSAFGKNVNTLEVVSNKLHLNEVFYNNMNECRRCGGAYDHQMHDSCPCLEDVYGRSDADNVNHPEHYQSESGIECIDAIRAAVGYDGFVAHCRATAIKYAWRSGKKKAHAEDLRKAAWYLDKAASVIEERG